MNPIKQWHRNWVGAIVGIVITVGLGLVVWDFEFSLSKSLRHLSYDQPFLTRTQEIPDDVILVYLDDRSHQLLEQPYNAPWNRKYHTELLQRATREGARAVVFDIIFSDPSPDGPAVDSAFAQAIEENGNVILAADLVRSEVSGAESHELSTIVTPYEPFDERCADIGFASLKFDPDLAVRAQFHADRDSLVDSLTWATARHLGIKVTEDDENRFVPRWINYYGPPRSLPHVRISDVVGEDAKPGILFKDKIVYVGAHLQTYNSGERKDELVSPWSTWDLGGENWKFIAGVEVHATTILNLIRQDWINQISKPVQLIFFSGLGILLGGGLILLRPLAATLVAVGAAGFVVVLAHYLHWIHRLWFPWMIALAVQIPVAWVVSVVFNSVKLYVQKQLLEQSIRAYLSPKLVRAFANRSDENFLKPGATKQELSILFSDIEGFTSLSEGMDSSEQANLMNGYFEATVSHGIHATDGTVVKYIGDAIFAFWNAPEPQSDHATRACQAAIQIQNQPYRFSESKPVHTRVGIHSGVADVGNFGSANRVDYTAIGENINLASRLEGLNKYLGTRILISIETRRAASPDIITRNLGKFRLKGFERTVQVLEVLGTKETVQTHATEELPTFSKALEDFQHQHFDQAESGFETVLAKTPDDGPSQFYLNTIKNLQTKPPGVGWQGEVQLDEK